MESLESLKNSLESAKSLQGIVSTMKSIAAVNIKKYEKSALNLLKYKSNIDLGIQAIISQRPNMLNYLNYIENKTENNLDKRDVIIIIGSNQGLCGRFNDRITEFYLENCNNDINKYIITVGDRIDMIVKGKKVVVDKHFSLPNSIESIVNVVYDLFSIMEKFLTENLLRKVVIYFTSYSSGNNNGNLIKRRILPLEKKYFENLAKNSWPTNNIPFWRINTKSIITDLVQQYIFANLYFIIANSMASEQKNRLMTLQGAEQNIKDYIVETNLKYNQIRQNVITSELIDVVSGAKFLKKKK